MSATLTVYDETTAGDRSDGIELTFPTESITVRELIRERVYQEVQDYNVHQAQQPVFRGLVQPTGAEKAHNGYKLKESRPIEWKPQFDIAVEGFEKNQILVLVNEYQAESLDETFQIARGTAVSFLKLTPLVGG